METVRNPQLDELVFAGKLHIFVAFDWGEEVDLIRAALLVPAETQLLPRRRRTPASFVYRPAPLRYRLVSKPCQLPDLPGGKFDVEATVFDFGAVNLTLTTDFSLPADALTRFDEWSQGIHNSLDAAERVCTKFWPSKPTPIALGLWSSSS